MDTNRDAFDIRRCEGICIDWLVQGGRSCTLRAGGGLSGIGAQVAEHWKDCENVIVSSDGNSIVQQEPTSVPFSQFHIQLMQQSGRFVQRIRLRDHNNMRIGGVRTNNAGVAGPSLEVVKLEFGELSVL